MYVTLMNKYLYEISDIKSGILFKEKVLTDTEGDVKLIQLKDVDECGNINVNSINAINSVGLNRDDMLKEGDVIFKAKSSRQIASYIDHGIVNTFISAHFFIIKTHDSDIDPKYLAWYLNQRPAKIYFIKNGEGTRVRIINKKVLENIEVPIPEKEIQEKIIKIDQLSKTEDALIDMISGKQKSLIETKLLRAII